MYPLVRVVVSHLRPRFAHSTSSVTTGMRGAVAGVSPPRRSPPYTRQDSFGQETRVTVVVNHQVRTTVWARQHVQRQVFLCSDTYDLQYRYAGMGNGSFKKSCLCCHSSYQCLTVVEAFRQSEEACSWLSFGIPHRMCLTLHPQMPHLVSYAEILNKNCIVAYIEMVRGIDYLFDVGYGIILSDVHHCE